MSCGCGSGNSGISSTYTAPPISAQTVQGIPCSYTIEQVNIWLDKVYCFKDKNLYNYAPNLKRKEINFYIGILLSAQNYRNNVCYFAKQLAEIENFITLVDSIGVC